MPPDEVVETAEMLLKKARIDMGTIKEMMNSPDFYNSILGFHAQQAIEKAIKAVMVFKEIKLVRTHNLDELVEICKEASIEVPGISTSLDRITLYAVEERYIEIVSEDDVLNRKQLYADVTKIINWAEGIISTE